MDAHDGTNLMPLESDNTFASGLKYIALFGAPV